MAIAKRQAEVVDVDEIPSTPTNEYSLPPLFMPLPSKTATIKYPPLNGFTTSLLSFTPIATMTADAESATATFDIPYLPSFAPLSSREPVSVSTPVWPPPTPTAPSSSTTQQKNQSLSGGQIAGIAIGGVVGLLLFAFTIYVLCWSRREIVKSRKEKLTKQKPIMGTATAKLDKESRASNVAIDQIIKESVFDEENHLSSTNEKNQMHNDSHDGNQPSALPRLGKYDPNRRYSPTSSPNSNLKEDFRSYYRARTSAQGGTSSKSSSADSETPLTGGRSPFYGGFNVYYAPTIQQQMPAVYHQHNTFINPGIYNPHFTPPPGHASSMPIGTPSDLDYYQQPRKFASV